MYRVLLVDDEEKVTRGLSRFVKWEDNEFQVVGTANSAATALELIKKECVDLLITDIQMPEENGLTLIEKALQISPKLKTIILSAYSDFSYAQQAMRLGATDYLTKPINFGQLNCLLLKIKDMLNQERQSNTVDIKDLLSKTLLLNMANGTESDLARASEWFNLDATIVVVRCAVQGIKKIDSDVITQLKKHLSPCYVMESGPEELFCVIEFELSSEEFGEMLNQIHKKYEALCFGISEFGKTYREISILFHQASHALRYQMARSSTGITYFDQLNTVFTGIAPHDEQDFQMLVDIFLDPDRRQMLWNAFDQIFIERSLKSNYSLDNMQKLCIQFLVVLDAPLQRIASPEFPRHQELRQALLEMLACHDVADLKNIMKNYVVKCIDTVSQTDQNQQSGELIIRMQQFIQEHYAQSLSLKVLSETFYVCPAYLSRLFKRKTGTNFVDYLTQLRMEKAKEFLKNKELLIYDVAALVGYENPRYFSRLFKETTGHTPQEYREM